MTNTIEIDFSHNDAGHWVKALTGEGETVLFGNLICRGGLWGFNMIEIDSVSENLGTPIYIMVNDDGSFDEALVSMSLKQQIDHYCYSWMFQRGGEGASSLHTCS